MSKTIKVRNVFRIDVPPEANHEDFRDYDRIPYSKTVYDNNGNIIGEDKYDDHGNMIGRMLYKYDEGNKLIGEETYNELGELEEKLSYEYNAEDKVVKKFVHYLDGSVDTVTYEYAGDHLIRKVLIDEDGEIESEEIFTFHGDKLVKEEKLEFGELIRENKFAFDEKGNVVEATIFNEDENSKVIHEYDEEGNRTGVFKYDDDDKLIEKSLFKFNENGKVSEVLEEDPYKKNTVLMEYDEKGNAVHQKEIDRDGIPKHEVYRDYDDNDDLTEVRATIYKPIISGKDAFATTIQTVAAISEANAGDVVMPDRKYMLVYENEYWEE